MFRAKYTTGSSCVLPNPHDEDILVIYDTKEEAREALINNKDRSKDYHFKSIEDEKRIFSGCYVRHFMKLIEGEKLDVIEEFNFLNHRHEYFELAQRFFLCEYPRTHKRWYHIYLAYVFFKKGKMTLTKKEKEKAQEIHDNGVDEEMYNTLIEYFK